MAGRGGPEQPARKGGAAMAGAVLRGLGRLSSRGADKLLSGRGAGFRRLAESQAASVAGDALVTLALANTLFFQVPSTDARNNVALYLLITLAPFAVIGPVLGTIYARFPAAYRAGLTLSAAGRTVVAVLMIVVGVNTLWLYPLAFVLLVFSRFHGISRSSLLPVVLERPVELVGGNAQMARVGVVAGGITVAIAAPFVSWLGSGTGLFLAIFAFALSTYSAIRVPASPDRLLAGHGGEPQQPRRLRGDRKGRIPRSVRLARLATAGVRFLNGFLLLLIAFEFRDADAGFFDFGALLGAAGAGFFLAALSSPWLERRLREEPMVVAALAVEAAAAFIGAQAFGLPAAAALAAAAGFAWGTAKFAFDGLLQATVDPSLRAATFSGSETIFQLVWVTGAVIPILVTVPIELGLAVAGISALGAQVVYISGLLIPLNVDRRTGAPIGRLDFGEDTWPGEERRDVTEFL